MADRQMAVTSCSIAKVLYNGRRQADAVRAKDSAAIVLIFLPGCGTQTRKAGDPGGQRNQAWPVRAHGAALAVTSDTTIGRRGSAYSGPSRFRLVSFRKRFRRPGRGRKTVGFQGVCQVGRPEARASKFSCGSGFYRPAVYFKAAPSLTITAAAGTRPVARHLMSRIFQRQIRAKPASVTKKSRRVSGRAGTLSCCSIAILQTDRHDSGRGPSSVWTGWL